MQEQTESMAGLAELSLTCILCLRNDSSVSICPLSAQDFRRGKEGQSGATEVAEPGTQAPGGRLEHWTIHTVPYR